MKNLLKITLSLLFIAASFTSCVDDKDFDTPQVVEIDNDIATADLSSIRNNILNQYNSSNPAPSQLIYTYPEDSGDIVAAYVVSDDTSGNYYKKLIVQDKPENPTMGFEISIDQGNLHAIYNKGRKVYIKMAGLTVGYYDGQQGPSSTNYENQSNPTDGVPGIYRIGVENDGMVGRIQRTDFLKIIIKSSVTEVIVPQLIADTDFSDSTMNTFVTMENVQFDINDIDKTFANEPGDAYDATRTLFGCDTENLFGLMTSTFSNFKSIKFSMNDFLAGKGTLKGVLTKSFREANSVIVLNSIDDIDFSDTDRCDPVLLDCGLATTEGTTDLLVENFDGGIPATWTNYIQEGTKDWIGFTDDNAYDGPFVKMGSYQSGDTSSIAWLISPVIDMDAQTGETLEFKTSNSYSDNSKLELMFSTDWDGTEAGVATANWGLLSAATIVDDDEYYQNWVSSGIVDLSCAEGTSFYIAFKYTGSGDSSSDGTYELDDFKLKY